MGRFSYIGCRGLLARRLVSITVLVSLAFGATNHLDKSSVEASSPEDQLQQSLPGFDPSSQLQSPKSLSLHRDPNDPQTKPQVKTIPLLTPSVFPYQPNPIAAVVAAGLTLAVVSLKETGKVDVNGILWLLNNSDYYAGIIGSIVSAFGEKKTAQFISSAIQKGIKASPKVMKPIFDNQAAKAFGNIVNGFTYTFAVSAGFEVFSQFWMYATKNVPEVRTMTGLLKASNAKRKQVIGNLLYYCIVDGNMQKRLLNSVYNHRILTYEFIATNIAMYIGGQVGSILAKRYGAGHPILQRIAPVIGSISGGLIVQLVPDSWKNAVNRDLLEYKISNARENLTDALGRVDSYIQQRVYPAEDRDFTGYFLSGVNLPSDLDRVFRARDLLNSLEFEKMAYEQQPQGLFEQVRADQRLLLDTFDRLHTDLEQTQTLTPSEQIDRWIAEKKTPEEIAQLSLQQRVKDPQRDFYKIMISASLDRVKSRSSELEGLFLALENAAPMPDLSEVIIDMSVSNR